MNRPVMTARDLLPEDATPDMHLIAVLSDDTRLSLSVGYTPYALNPTMLYLDMDHAPEGVIAWAERTRTDCLRTLEQHRTDLLGTFLKKFPFEDGPLGRFVRANGLATGIRPSLNFEHGMHVQGAARIISYTFTAHIVRYEQP